jgi:outer membrane receptor for ferrienterochelin and colicin
MVKDIEMTPAVIGLDSIVVSGGYFAQDNLAPHTTFTYSREEIRRSPGASGDILRAIETLPGVSSSGGEFSAFAVRGGSPRENIVLIDGIPFDKISHFEGGSEEEEAQGGRFSIFTPGIIDEAHFVAGGFSARYGGKHSSLVDLKMKEGNAHSFRLNGIYDLLGPEINYDGPSYIFSNTSVLFSARHQNFKTLLELVDQKEVGQTSFSDIILKTTTAISPAHKLSFLGIYAPEEFTRTVENVFEAKDENYNTFIGFANETKYLLGANWRYLWGETGFLETILYYRRTDADQSGGRVYVDPIGGVRPTATTAVTRPNYITAQNSDQETGLKLQMTVMSGERSTMFAGIEASQTSYDVSRVQNGLDTVYVFDRDDLRPDPSKKFIITDPAFVNTDARGRRANGAAFVEYQTEIFDDVTVLPGLRYEYHGLSKEAILSPRFSAKWRIAGRTALNGSVGVYTQPPPLFL